MSDLVDNDDEDEDVPRLFDHPDTEHEDVTVLQRAFGRLLRESEEDLRYVGLDALDSSLPLARAGDANGVSVDVDQYITTLRPKSACGYLRAISMHVRSLRYDRGDLSPTWIESKDATVTR